MTALATGSFDLTSSMTEPEAVYCLGISTVRAAPIASTTVITSITARQRAFMARTIWYSVMGSRWAQRFGGFELQHPGHSTRVRRFTCIQRGRWANRRSAGLQRVNASTRSLRGCTIALHTVGARSSFAPETITATDAPAAAAAPCVFA